MKLNKLHPALAIGAGMLTTSAFTCATHKAKG